MKISITLRPSKEASAKGLSKVCFRVREKSTDIKVVSEITVIEKYWNPDILAYERNSPVPKEERKKTSMAIAEVAERAAATFSCRADSAWLKGIIEDVLYRREEPELRHPCMISRIHEYYERYDGAKSSRAGIMDLERKMSRYYKYRREIEGEQDFRLSVETISLEEINAFRDYVAGECELRKKYPEMYAGCFVRKSTPKPVSDSTVINVMNIFCVFLRWCRKMGYTQSDAFLQYGCRTPVYGDPFYLTIEERNRLYDADLDADPELAIIRDIFVFHCYIGCRVGDLYRLTRDNVKDGFVEYIPQKTKKCLAKTVRVPLHDKAMKILERYQRSGSAGIPGVPEQKGKRANMPDKRLLPFRPVARYNAGIKELLKYCGIDRVVTLLDTHGYETVRKPLYEVATSHTARKTFIGNLYRQVPDPNLIASMSGHAEGSVAFRRYRCIDDEMKRRLVELIN